MFARLFTAFAYSIIRMRVNAYPKPILYPPFVLVIITMANSPISRLLRKSNVANFSLPIFRNLPKSKNDATKLGYRDGGSPNYRLSFVIVG